MGLKHLRVITITTMGMNNINSEVVIYDRYAFTYNTWN